VAPAGITGLLGYFAARLGANGTIRQVEAEKERLRAQYDQAARDHRQNYYHQAMNALERLRQGLTFSLPFATGEFMPWLETWRTIVTGVVVFGTDGARVAAEAMNRVVIEIEDTLEAPEGAYFFPLADVRTSHAELWQSFIETRDELLAGMREDVAPSSGR
jgi:hypothetical protein